MNFNSTISSTRGAVGPIGYILLIGITVSVAVGMSTIAISALETTSQQTSQQEIQTTFQSIGSSAMTVGFGGNDTQKTVDLTRLENANNISVSENSSIELYEINTAGDKNLILEEDLGYVEYKDENEDMRFYYENGGVWKYNQEAISTVTKPQFHYRDNTLTFPMLPINSTIDSADTQLRFTHGGSERSTETLAVENERIEIHIQSPVYKGWARYFETEYGFETDVNDEEQTVVVEIGLTGSLFSEFSDATLASGDVDIDGNGTVSGDIAYGGSFSGDEDNIDGTLREEETDFAQVNPLIEQKRSQAINEGTYIEDSELSSTDFTQDDMYYMDNINLNSDQTITIYDDTEIVVDGDVTIENSRLTVDARNDAELTTYIVGDLTIQRGSGTGWVTASDTTRENFVLMSDDSSVVLGQQAEFQGVLYASSDGSASSGNNNNNGNGRNGGGGHCRTSDYTVCLGQGGPSVEGSIVTGSLSMSQNAELDYDESLEDFNKDLTTDVTINRISYLHTSSNTVEISED